MKTFCLTSVLFVALAAVQTVSGQTNRRRTPAPAPTTVTESVPVSVLLKDGQTLKGKFVAANPKKLSIIVGSSPQEMNMSDIASLIFSEAPSTKGTDNASLSAPREAIKALRKLDSATEAGVTRAEYGTRLIDAKAAVDDLLPKIPDGELKSEIGAAMREYVSAGDVWQLIYNINVDEIRDGRGAAGTIIDVPKWLIEKYNLKPDDPGGSEQTAYGTVHHPPRYVTNSILSAVWRTAKSHLDKAAQLVP